MATQLFRRRGDQFFDNAGQMLVGGKLYYHEAGTSNLQTTYANAAGTVPNKNPLVLDGYGRLQESVYFGDTGGFADYKETLTTSGVAIIAPWPIDNIPAAPPAGASVNFASLEIPWQQKTNSQSPIALSVSDLGSGFEADATSGDVEFDLPSASLCTNKGFWFKKVIGNNRMILDPFGSQTIDNSATSMAITTNNAAVGIFSNGAEWYITGGFNIDPPTGSIVAWPSATPPNGWLECNGGAISRTTFSQLFAVISDDYGIGDGATTFNVPDLRGRFIRGWSHGSGADPDAATRTNRGDGVAGDNVGTKQAGQVQSHTHGLLHNPANIQNTPSGVTGFFAYGLPATSSTGATGGNETRPVNINLMYIIKF